MLVPRLQIDAFGMRTSLLSIATCITFVVLTGCGSGGDSASPTVSDSTAPLQSNTPNDNSATLQQSAPTNTPTETNEPQQEYVDGPAQFKLKPEEFSGEFISNNEAAIAKYNNTVVEMTGYVFSLGGGSDDMGNPVASVLIEPEDIDPSDPKVHEKKVRCYLDIGQLWKSLTPGEIAVVKGVVAASKYSHVIKRCTIIRAEGEGIPQASSEEVAANPYKHRGRIVVTGKLLATNIKESAGIYTVSYVLAGSEGKTIGLHCTSDVKKSFEGLQTGDTVTVLGDCKPLSAKMKYNVLLEFCQRMDTIK